MKKILILLLISFNVFAMEWHLLPYITSNGKQMNEEKMAISFDSELGTNILVFKNVCVFYVNIPENLFNVGVEREFLIYAPSEELLYRATGTSGVDKMGTYIGFNLNNYKDFEKMLLNNNVLDLIITSSGEEKVRFETKGFSKVNKQISRTNWDKIEKIENEN